jgi:hypothetical protein
MKTLSRRLLTSLLLASIAGTTITGCSLKKADTPIPEASIGANDRKFPEEVETFAKDLEKVKVGYRDSVAAAFEQATELSTKYLNLQVPVNERKHHAKEIVKLMTGVAKAIPEMQKEVKAMKTPASISPVVAHFVAHLEALKDEALAYQSYTELACSAQDPTKDPKFLAAFKRVNELGQKRQAEMQAFQQGMVGLSVAK